MIRENLYKGRYLIKETKDKDKW